MEQKWTERLRALAPFTNVPRSESQQQAPPPEIEGDNQAMKKLHEIRAEILDLTGALDDLRSGQATLDEYQKYLKKTRKDIDGLMSQLGTDGDNLRHLHNTWELLKTNPLLAASGNSLDAKELLNSLSLAESQIEKALFRIGIITVPGRLNSWLNQSRPGYYVPFHLVFSDEIPSAEVRARVLNYLRFAPTAIEGGIIDPASGLVYKFNERRWKRWSSVIGLLVAVALATLLVYWVARGTLFANSDPVGITIGWLAVLLGLVIHAAVGTLKRSQEDGLPPIVALGDIDKYADSRIGLILFRLLLALITYSGFVLTVGAEAAKPINALLVGYSLDSVLELFGSSLEKQAKGQVAALQRQLGLE